MKSRGENRKGVSNLIAILVIILVSISIFVGIFGIVRQEIRESAEEVEKRVQAISNIALQIIDVYILQGNLVIEVQNTGSQEISSFIVKVTSSDGDLYTNTSVYLSDGRKLGLLNKDDLLIIPAPFGVNLSDYGSVVVTPRFEFEKIGEESEEVIAETARDEVRLLGFRGVSGGSGGECIVDYSGVDGNLVLNPYAECDLDGDGEPDGWVRYAEDGDHVLDWGDDLTKGSKVFKSVYEGVGGANSFGWRQAIPAKPNTWYEFSVSFAAEDIEPVINSSNDLAIGRTLGVQVFSLDSHDKRVGSSGFWVFGANLTDWDEDDWNFRDYGVREREDWRSVKKYFKTPPTAVEFDLKTYNYLIGKGYFDDMVIKEVQGNYNPDELPLKKSGTLEFIKYKGQDFFPIVSWGYPERGAQDIDLGEIKGNGFNTVCFSYRGYPTYGDLNSSFDLFRQEDLAIILTPLFIAEKNWKYDPNNLIDDSLRIDRAKSRIDAWGAFENTLLYWTAEEIDCHDRLGYYLPDLRRRKVLYDYLKNKTSQGLMITNYCGREEPYTGVKEDIDYYYALADVATFSFNLPLAYPTTYRDRRLNTVKDRTKRIIQMSETGNGVLPLAMVPGVLGWMDETPAFNLFRYQAWSQIVNGAVGAFFYYGRYMNLDVGSNQQIYEDHVLISKELSLLNDVLLEQEFYDEWQVSDDRIDIMMKKHNGKIYLFSVSNHYEDIDDVVITLPDYEISSVKCINDVVSGGSLVDRNVNVNLDKTSFTDDFTGVGGAGYDVNIYEIDYI